VIPSSPIVFGHSLACPLIYQYRDKDFKNYKNFFMPTTKARKTSSSNGNGKSKTAPKKSSSASASSDSENTQLEKFFHDALKDIYWAEKHLTKALPKMQKAATSEELQKAISDHLAQTQEHVNRLEQIFEQLGHKAQAKKCDGMEGLVKEGESAVEETEDGTATRDVGIIVSAQKVEHYEISAYGSLVQLATTMGHDDIAEILNETLEEEKEADALLTQIAENNINWQAEEEGEEEEKDDEEK
jgi:ferritin-like metal-binding protein YciE